MTLYRLTPENGLPVSIVLEHVVAVTDIKTSRYNASFTVHMSNGIQYVINEPVGSITYLPGFTVDYFETQEYKDAENQVTETAKNRLMPRRSDLINALSPRSY